MATRRAREGRIDGRVRSHPNSCLPTRNGDDREVAPLDTPSSRWRGSRTDPLSFGQRHVRWHQMPATHCPASSVLEPLLAASDNGQDREPRAVLERHGHAPAALMSHSREAWLLLIVARQRWAHARPSAAWQGAGRASIPCPEAASISLRKVRRCHGPAASPPRRTAPASQLPMVSALDVAMPIPCATPPRQYTPRWLSRRNAMKTGGNSALPGTTLPGSARDLSRILARNGTQRSHGRRQAPCATSGSSRLDPRPRRLLQLGKVHQSASEIRCGPDARPRRGRVEIPPTRPWPLAGRR